MLTEVSVTQYSIVIQPPDRIRCNVEDAYDQDRLFIDPIENAVLPVTPATQAQAAGIVDLAGFGILAQEIEGVGQAGVIGVARGLAVHRGSVSENVEKVGVRQR